MIMIPHLGRSKEKQAG